MNTDFQARFDDLIDQIDHSIAQVQAGVIVEMGDLETTVTALCRDLEKAGIEDAKEAQPHMARMITRLDVLAHGLMELQVSGKAGRA